MVSVLVDDWLYVDENGKVSVYGRQEAKRSLNNKIKSVHAAFLDYQTRIVSVAYQQQDYFDKILNESFDASYLVNHERLSSGLIQVIGVKKEKIEEIYRDFKGIKIERLVPYAVAIRAVLKSRNLLESHPYIVFLEDMGNQLILTFFEGMRFSSPRRINVTDMSYVISEIKRSWQGFLSEQSSIVHSQEDSLCVISNNKKWLSDLVSQDFVKTNQIVHLDDQFPVLKGLSEAKFALHFALADEMVKQKRKELFNARLKMMALAIGLVLISSGLYFGSIFELQKENKILQDLIGYKKQQEEALKSLYQDKFLSLMDLQDSFDYQRIYFDFVNALPANYLIDRFKLERISEDVWGFNAVIYPNSNNDLLLDFNGDLFYSGTKITHIMTHKVLGQLITSQFNLRDQSL